MSLAGLGRAGQCGSCPAPRPALLNIHLVSHTHNDVGWLKTVDQYYYGALSEIQQAGVQYILDSVVQALLLDPERRFIYVESAFFWRWWGEQGGDMKRSVRQLVEQGRLEFIGGGWSMNDEAAAHYTAVIDNMSYGLKFLSEEFGECGRPRVAWQIDPFGHSREQAAIFARMGFDGLFFGRLDYADKAKRMADKTMEMVWEGDPRDRSGAADMFTGALYHGYSPPPGFCFDSHCVDVIMDDPRLEDYNLDSKVAQFLNFSRQQAQSYATNNIILTMGEDFTYENANMWFKNLDKLRTAINSRSSELGAWLHYSTPSCYIAALHQSNHTWPRKTDDFMPYASDRHSYWSGYFTSRPALKGMIRAADGQLQACKQVSVRLGQPGDARLETARRALAVTQHHDAVTGTAKQAVTDDYAARLAAGTAGCSELISSLLAPGCPAAHCPLLNISQCATTETLASFTVTLYNPRAGPATAPVRVPVVEGEYRVADSAGGEVRSQLVPVADPVLSLPGRHSRATHELVWLAADLPPLGTARFSVIRHQSGRGSIVTAPLNRPTSLSNGLVRIQLDRQGGLTGIKTGDAKARVTQQFAVYTPAVGDNSSPEKRASGAYIFRPASQQAEPVPGRGATLVRGPVVQEVHQQLNNWTSQVLRLYAGSELVEVVWQVGPLPGERGREVVTRYSSDIQSEDRFVTDSNGRGLIGRRRNRRPSWNLNLTEPVAGNYFPVVNRLGLRGKAGDTRQLWITTDRSQGGTSLTSGQLELMLHRRLLHDDAFGVGEPLNETQWGTGLVVRGTHTLLLCGAGDCAARSRAAAEAEVGRPLVLVTSPCPDSPAPQPALLTPLPAPAKLLTLEWWTGGAVLVRVEHTGGADPVSVFLPALLPRAPVTVTETMLDGNTPLAGAERLQWGRGAARSPPPPAGNTVQLQPGQIRTFVITLANSQK